MGGAAPVTALPTVRPDPLTGIRVRRVYDEPGAADGARVLVDRIWPRGLRKDALQLDDWARDVAPSADLRKWYGHDPAKFSEFRERYLDELGGATQRAALGRLRARAAAGPLTLLTATRDLDHSQAAVLGQLLRSATSSQTGAGDAACFAHLICPECGAVASESHNPGCPHLPPAPAKESV
jgi:uncharacterized protein YeaO (DUF488 family)